jgi:hypothetical protein
MQLKKVSNVQRPGAIRLRLDFAFVFGQARGSLFLNIFLLPKDGNYEKTIFFPR